MVKHPKRDAPKMWVNPSQGDRHVGHPAYRFTASESARSGRTGEQAIRAQVFVDVRPVNLKAAAAPLPVLALLGCRTKQAEVRDAFAIRRPGSLDRGARNVGTGRVDVDLAVLRRDDQVHVFHGDGAEEDLIAHDQRAGEAHAVLEANLDRADIGHEPSGAVGDGHFLLVRLFEAELDGDVLRNAQVNRAGIREGLDHHGFLVRITWIA